MTSDRNSITFYISFEFLITTKTVFGKTGHVKRFDSVLRFFGGTFKDNKLKNGFFIIPRVLLENGCVRLQIASLILNGNESVGYAIPLIKELPTLGWDDCLPFVSSKDTLDVVTGIGTRRYDIYRFRFPVNLFSLHIFRKIYFPDLFYLVDCVSSLLLSRDKIIFNKIFSRISRGSGRIYS